MTTENKTPILDAIISEFETLGAAKEPQKSKITYTLQSSPMVHTPGLIAWAINGYAFEADRPAMRKVIGDTFQTLPADAIDQLLSEAVPFTVDNGTVIFEAEV